MDEELKQAAKVWKDAIDAVKKASNRVLETEGEEREKARLAYEDASLVASFAKEHLDVLVKEASRNVERKSG